MRNSLIFLLFLTFSFSLLGAEPFNSEKFYYKNGTACVILNGQYGIEFLVLIKSINGNVSFLSDHKELKEKKVTWTFASNNFQELTLVATETQKKPYFHKFTIYYEDNHGKWVKLEDNKFIYTNTINLKKLVDELIASW